MNRFVPIEEVAKHLSVSVSTIRSWVRKKDIPESTYIKVGPTYRFDLKKVVSSLQEESYDRDQHWYMPDTDAEDKYDGDV